MSESNQLPSSSGVNLPIGNVGIDHALGAVSYNITCIERFRKAAQEARQKSSELDSEFKEIDEKLLEKRTQISMGQGMLVSKECDLSCLAIKMMVLDDIFKKLEVELETRCQNLKMSKEELYKASAAMLQASTEFLQRWNFANSGVAFRKQLRCKMLEDILTSKTELNRELESYLENKKAYTAASDKKMKLETDIDTRMKDLTHKESDFYGKLRKAEHNVQKLQNLVEKTSLENYASHKMRLEGQIRSAENFLASAKMNVEKLRAHRHSKLNENVVRRSQGISVQQKPNPRNTISDHAKGQHTASTNHLTYEPPLKFGAVNLTADRIGMPARSEFAVPADKPARLSKCFKLENSSSEGTFSCSNTSQKFQFKKKLSNTPSTSTSDSFKEHKILKPCLKVKQQSNDLSHSTALGFTSAKNIYHSRPTSNDAHKSTK